jgi:hypothetical protein
MKGNLWVSFAALALAGTVLAAGNKIDKPFEALVGDLDNLSGNQGEFSGDDCTVDYDRLDSTTLRLTYSQNGKKGARLFVHDGKLKGTSKTISSDGETHTYTDTANGNAVIIELAGDAFNTVTLKVGSKQYACEQDM